MTLRHLVGRAEREDFTPARIREMFEYLTARGLDPTRFALQVALTDAGGRHQLHLTEYLKNEDGHTYLDIAANRPVTAPHVIEVGVGEWPEWLPGLGLPVDEPATGRTVVLGRDAS